MKKAPASMRLASTADGSNCCWNTASWPARTVKFCITSKRMKSVHTYRLLHAKTEAKAHFMTSKMLKFISKYDIFIQVKSTKKG